MLTYTIYELCGHNKQASYSLLTSDGINSFPCHPHALQGDSFLYTINMNYIYIHSILEYIYYFTKTDSMRAYSYTDIYIIQ